MKMEVWSEVIKDIVVAGCVLTLTYHCVNSLRDMDPRIVRIANGWVAMEGQIGALAKVARNRAFQDDQAFREIKATLQNLNATTREAARAARNTADAAAAARDLIRRTDDNLNGEILPELSVQIHGLGTDARLVLQGVRDGVAVLSVQARDIGVAARAIAEHADAILEENRATIAQILQHCDQVVIHVGETSAQAAEISRTVNAWSKDTLKKQSILIRIASGLVGAVIPRIIK